MKKFSALFALAAVLSLSSCGQDVIKSGGETHIYVAEVIQPTCLERGYTVHTCRDCGESYIDNYVDALGHDYIEHPAQAATCTEGGWNAYQTCSRCDYNTKVDIAATGHHYGDFVVDVEPTCTEDGHKYQECSGCHDKIEETIPATGHSYGDFVIDIAPTCTEKGHQYKTCSACDSVIEEEIPATGHSYGDFVVDKEATCTEDGLRHKECSVCGDKAEEVIPAAHKYGEYIVELEPTCTEEGSRYRICSVCNNKEEVAIPALGHDYVDHDGKDATCTEGGWEAYKTCSRCDFTSYKAIEAKGHNYDVEFTIDKAATCLEAGEKSRHCSVCGDRTEITAIEALGHDIVKYERKAPTCTEAGHEAYEACSRCDYSTFKSIDPTGHTYGDFVVDVEPTCTETGHRYKACADCGDKIEETIPALGHDYVDHAAQAATCTEAGWEAYQTCSRCDYSSKVEIAALGHDYGDDGLSVACTHGCGTMNSGFKAITSADDLKNIATDLDGHYYLANDIDLGSSNWVGIDNFTGILDGNGKTISNLLSEARNDEGNLHSVGGLFATNEGTIRNLTINNFSSYIYYEKVWEYTWDNYSDPNISGTYGAFCGINEGKIENCVLSGSVIMWNDRKITRKFNSADGNNGSVNDSSTAYFGGLVGINGSKGLIESCTNSATTELRVNGYLGSSLVSMLVLTNDNMWYLSMYGDYGGLVGTNEGTMRSCSTSGKTSFIGYLSPDCQKHGVFGSAIGWAVTVNLDAYAGTLAGRNLESGSVYNCSSTTLNLPDVEIVHGGFSQNGKSNANPTVHIVDDYGYFGQNSGTSNAVTAIS